MHVYDHFDSYTVVLTIGSPQGTDTTIRVGLIETEGFGDTDIDDDVDLGDFAFFRANMLGPAIEPLIENLPVIDGNADDDVDLGDFRRFQGAFTGCETGSCP